MLWKALVRLMRIATSVCVADSADAILYPQLQGLDSNTRADVYWRCAAALLASLRRTNPEVELFLVSDVDVATAAPAPMPTLLDRLQVTTVHLKFETFLPPAHASRKFRNNFYKLDVLSYLAGLPDAPPTLLLDSDVIALRPLNGISAQCADGLVVYHPYRDGRTDQRSRDLLPIVKPLFADLGQLNYVGGESIGGPTQHLQHLSRLLESGYLRATELAATDQLPRLVTGDCVFDNDEYLLTGALSMLETTVSEISPWLRRIHTNTRFYDARPSDVDLELWHLPGEKTRGFRPLYDAVTNPASWFWHAGDEDFRRRAGQLLGVPTRSTLKKLAYAARGSLNRLKA
jgi:hypothetical protein